MAAKKTAPINLFDYALGIDGPAPITINVGDGIELPIRRSHTGEQVVAFTENENERIRRAAEVLGDTKMSDETKLEAVGTLMLDYTRQLLTILTDDVDTAVIEEAADRIVALPNDARAKVYVSLGNLAGVVDEEGKYLSTTSSEIVKPTNG